MSPMTSASVTLPNLAYPVKRLDIEKGGNSESLNHTRKFSDIGIVGINGYPSISVRSDVQTIKLSLRKHQLQKLDERSFCEQNTSRVPVQHPCICRIRLTKIWAILCKDTKVCRPVPFFGHIDRVWRSEPSVTQQVVECQIRVTYVKDMLVLMKARLKRDGCWLSSRCHWQSIMIF